MSKRKEEKESKVLAILLADIHLSLKAPVWRSAEPDWFKAQARPLNEVKQLQEKYDCPIICAGDIFDKWNAPAELINFALENLPDNMYAIPGQHDLPNHQYCDIERSAYWTLAKVGKITNISEDLVNIASLKLTLYGFYYGKELNPCEISSKFLQVVIIHDYIWIDGYSYSDAPREKQLGRKISKFRNGKWFGYDVVVYGDNHKGFLGRISETQVFNCGTLMRRKSDEIDYKPQVGLLLADGSVVPHYLDTSKDKYIAESKEKLETSLEMGDFLNELEKLGKTSLDFVEAMKEFLHSGKTSNEVKQIILDAMEK